MSDLLVVVDASVWVSWLRPSETNHKSSSIWMEQFISRKRVPSLQRTLLKTTYFQAPTKLAAKRLSNDRIFA